MVEPNSLIHSVWETSIVLSDWIESLRQQQPSRLFLMCICICVTSLFVFQWRHMYQLCFCFCCCWLSAALSYPAAAPLWGLRRWYSTSSTVQTAPLTFSTRMKHLWRDKLCRTAFYSVTTHNTHARTHAIERQTKFSRESFCFLDEVGWDVKKREKEKNTMQFFLNWVSFIINLNLRVESASFTSSFVSLLANVIFLTKICHVIFMSIKCFKILIFPYRNNEALRKSFMNHLNK